MDLRDYLAVLARRWRTVLGLTLVCLCAGIGTAFVLPPSYTAKAQLFVSTSTGAPSSTQLYQGSNFSQQRVKSYAQLATSPQVTRTVVNQLKLGITPRELAANISAAAPPDTVLLDIKVSNETARQAAVLANAVATRLGHVVQNIETPPGDQTPPVKASVVRKAQPPQQADQPRLPTIIGLAFLVGLAFGIGAAVLRESMDTSVKSGEDLRQAAGLPTLATIRYDPVAKDEPILQDDVGSPRAEAYRQLRTNMQYADVDHHPRVMVVTSAVSGEGKSVVTGNLGMAMAQLGMRVCLLDGDLRRPRCAEYFNLVPEVGLTTVLIGRASVQQVLQRADDQLDVMASGDTPPNPSELLGSERMRELLRDLSQRYDMVLIDAPPALPVTDASVLASSADASLVVVRAGRTSRSQLGEAVEALQNVGSHMLGGVLNMAPRKRSSSYAYGGYYYPHKKAPREQVPRSSTGETKRARRPGKVPPREGLRRVVAPKGRAQAKTASRNGNASQSTDLSSNSTSTNGTSKNGSGQRASSTNGDSPAAHPAEQPTRTLYPQDPSERSDGLSR